MTMADQQNPIQDDNQTTGSTSGSTSGTNLVTPADDLLGDISLG